MKLYRLLYSYTKSSIFIKAFLILLFILFTSGVLFHLLEPSLFLTLFDGIWFAVVTAFTVGYGDLVPSYISTKILAILLIIMGGASVTYFASIVATRTFKKQNAINEGLISYNGAEHYIIVGWNSKVKQLLDNYSKGQEKNDIVLIDESLTQLPASYPFIHFIRGNPTVDHTYDLASLSSAKKVLITADQKKNEQNADNLTILTTLTVKSLNSSISIIAEILSRSQVDNLKRAGATDIIFTNQYASHLMSSSLLNEETASLVNQLLDRTLPHNLGFEPVTKELLGTSIHEVKTIFEEKHLLVIGLKRNQEFLLNPVPSEILLEDDQIIIIT